MEISQIIQNDQSNLPDILTGEAFSGYLVNIILNVIFCLGVLFTTFIIVNTYERSKIHNYIISKFKVSIEFNKFITGALVSLFSLWYLFMKDVNWSYSIFLLAAISFAFFYNIYFYMGFLPLTIVVMVFLYFSPNKGAEINSTAIYDLIQNAIILFLATIFGYLSRWLKWKNNSLFLLTNITIMGITIAVMFPVVYSQAITPLTPYQMSVYGIDYVFYLIIAFSSFSLFKIAKNFIMKTEKLSLNVSFKKGFILQKYSKEQIKRFIVDENVSYAVVMRIDITGTELLTTKQGLSFASSIKDEAITLLKDKLENYKSIFYMQANDTEFFTMIKLDEIPNNTSTMINGNSLSSRKPTDILKFIEKAIKKSKLELIEKMNEEVSQGLIEQSKLNEIEFAAFCALYGVETNDLDQINNILNKCNKANISATNEVVYIKMDSGLDIVKKSKDNILSEYGLFSPTSINIKFKVEPFKQWQLYHIKAISIKPFLTTKQEIWDTTDNKVISSTLMCHTSAKGIKQFLSDGLNKDKNILLLDYPKYFISQKDFNLYELNSHISSYGLEKDKFILNIYFDNLEISEIFIDNINNIKRGGIKIAFANINKAISKSTLKKLKELNPELISYCNQKNKQNIK